jgi:hypothetical protein
MVLARDQNPNFSLVDLDRPPSYQPCLTSLFKLLAFPTIAAKEMAVSSSRQHTMAERDITAVAFCFVCKYRGVRGWLYSAFTKAIQNAEPCLILMCFMADSSARRAGISPRSIVLARFNSPLFLLIDLILSKHQFLRTIG